MTTHMKKIILLIPLILSGCAFPQISKLDAQIPNGNWEQARVHVSGKFTSTTLTGTGQKVDGKWTKGELHFKHTNPWITEATVDLKVEPNK